MKAIVLVMGALLVSAGYVGAFAGTPTDVQWDDYTFRIVNDTSVQVLQQGAVVGSIVTSGGEEHVSAVAGQDADKIKKSYDDYRAFAARSHGAVGAIAAGGNNAASNAGSAAVQFDAATGTVVVPQADGTTVTFAGNDIKISGARPGMGYLLRYQKGSFGRMLESHSIGHNWNSGGSISGGGVEFLHESGGLIYDSGMGAGSLTFQENPQVLRAKQLAKVAVDAVASVQQVPGHENFKPPGYDTLKTISQYTLRSDGSR